MHVTIDSLQEHIIMTKVLEIKDFIVRYLGYKATKDEASALLDLYSPSTYSESDFNSAWKLILKEKLS